MMTTGRELLTEKESTGMYILGSDTNNLGASVKGGQPDDTDKGYSLPQLFEALSSSMAVSSHLEFYTWLQQSISPLLPHELLLSARGNFRSGKAKLDVASSIPGVNTKNAYEANRIVEYLDRLSRHPAGRQSSWFVLHNPQPGSEIVSLARCCGMGPELSTLVRSSLICSLKDELQGETVFYVFFSLGRKIDISTETFNLLLPHIEAATRKFKSLDLGTDGQTTAQTLLESPLSDREYEIMQWVCEGKSNVEIGSILGISHNTVKNHLKKIFGKMNVSARSQAVRVFLQMQEQRA